MKLWAYLAIAVALAGFLAYGAHIVKKANRTDAAESALVAERHNNAVRISQIEKEAAASLALERENTRKANEVSAKYQNDLVALQRERAAPLGPIRLCRPKAETVAISATGGSNDPATGHVSEATADDLVAGPDISDQLLEYGIDSEANKLQLERLQEWVRNR